MKKKVICFILFCLLFSKYSVGVDTLNPSEIMQQYGDAVVLIATVRNSEELGLGSGFIAKSSGVIITNYHVIEGAYPALVKLKNGDIYEDISVIDYNERKDIAVIKIKGFELPVVDLGNSDKVKIGEQIVVIGNPHGFENTISDGLLSQIRHTDLGYQLHQISAPISAGSSGSPVFNLKGEVIGIATLSDVLGQNINFSVPINYIRGMIDEPVKYSLKEFSTVEKDQTILNNLKTQKMVENKDFLDSINNGITSLINAYEEAWEGYNEGIETNKRNPDGYFISPKIYTSNQELKNVYKDLDEINTNDKELKELKEKLKEAVKDAYNSSGELISALEYESPNAFGVYQPCPHWARAKAAVSKIEMAFRKIDKDFVAKLIDRIRKENPKLEDKLLPFVIFVYENKDKSEEEVAQERKKYGRLGVMLRLSTRIPIVLYIQDSSPAKKALLKKDDIILGVEEGNDFLTQMDYITFMKTTKPGERYKFKIERKGKILKKTIRLY